MKKILLLAFILSSFIFPILINATPNATRIIANRNEQLLCQQAKIQSGTYDPSQGDLIVNLDGPTSSDAQPQSLSIKNINGNNMSLTSSGVAPTGSGASFTFQVPSSSFGSQSSQSNFDANLDNIGISFEPQENTQNQSASCATSNQSARIQVTQQGQTQPQLHPDNNGGRNTGTTGCGNNCSKSAGVPCDPDNPTDTNGRLRDVGSDGGGVWTAIGCIPTSPPILIRKLLGFAAGVGGGIALLLMIMGAFQMMTSAGNPEGIKKGRDQFIAAAIGLLFIIFSALLLKIIGVDILNIPGFS